MGPSTTTSGTDGHTSGEGSGTEAGATTSPETETHTAELGVETVDSDDENDEASGDSVESDSTESSDGESTDSTEGNGDEDEGDIEDCVQGGGAWCGGRCVDPDSDATYCGAVGRCEAENRGQSCHSAAACEAGLCILQACPTEAPIECDGECFNPALSSDHCGAKDNCVGANAGQRCESPLSCVAGNCDELDIYESIEFLTRVPGTHHPWLLSATIDKDARLSAFWRVFGQIWLARELKDGVIEPQRAFELELGPDKPGPARAMTLRDGSPGLMYILDNHAWWWQASMGDDQPPVRITPPSPHAQGWYGFWSYAPTGGLCMAWKVPELSVELFTRCFDGANWSDVETISLPAATAFPSDSQYLWGADGSDYWSLASYEPENAWAMALRRDAGQPHWKNQPLPDRLLSHGIGNYHLVARGQQLAVVWIDDGTTPRKLSISHWQSGAWSDPSTITTGVDLSLRASAHDTARRSALLLHDDTGDRLAFGDAFANTWAFSPTRSVARATRQRLKMHLTQRDQVLVFASQCMRVTPNGGVICFDVSGAGSLETGLSELSRASRARPTSGTVTTVGPDDTYITMGTRRRWLLGQAPVHEIVFRRISASYSGLQAGPPAANSWGPG